MSKRVQVGCQNCRKCTASAVEVGARNTGRATAALFTMGMSEAGMLMMRKCRACGHPMSLHSVAQVQEVMPTPPVVIQQAPPAPAPQGPPPGWYPDPQGTIRWYDGTRWTEFTQQGAVLDAPQPQDERREDPPQQQSISDKESDHG